MTDIMNARQRAAEHRKARARLGIKPGPKPKPDKLKKSRTLFFSVTEDQEAKIQEAANRANLSLSSYLSKTILDLIDKEKKCR